MGNAIRIDREDVRDHVDRVVRSSVEETISALLEGKRCMTAPCVGDRQMVVARDGNRATR